MRSVLTGKLGTARGTGRAWAHGLFWQPVLSPTEMGRTVRRIAAEQGFDVYSTPRANALQAGFGSLRDGLKLGMPSFAAMISDFMESRLDSRSFIVALPLADGLTWAYVAQHGGVLLPDGDVIGSSEEIRSRVVADASSGDWSHVIAPADWDIPGSVDLPLAEVLKWADSERSRHKAWAIKRVRTDYTKLVVAAIVLAGVGITANTLLGRWHAYQLAQQTMLLAKQAATAPHAREALPKPWESQAPAVAQTRACLAAFAPSDAFGTGWTLKSVTCRNGMLSVVWDRASVGRIAALRARFPQAQFDLSGNLATAAIPVPAPKAGGHSVLESPSSVAEQLLSKAQDLDLGLVLTKGAPPQALPGAVPGTTGQPVGWTTFKWTLHGLRLDPVATVAHLDSPTLRVSAVDFDPVTMTWNLEGELYARP